MRRRLLFGERLLHGDGKMPFNMLIPFSLTGTFSTESIYHALAKVQGKHLWLNAYVKTDHQNRQWYVVKPEKINDIPLRIISREGDQDWERESLKEWALPFDTAEGPLMRVVWIKGAKRSDFILVFHHCLCDGVSGLNILSEILQVLDNPHVFIGVEQPVKTISDVIPKNVFYNCANRLKAKLKGGFMTLALKLIPVKKNPLSRGADYLIHWKMEEEATTALIQAAKAADITVNTVLCAALLAAFTAVRGGKAFNKISCPVDIRRFASRIRKDQIFAFGLMLVVSAAPATGFLERARLMQADINKKSAKLDPFRMIMMLEAAHGAMDNFSHFLKNGRSTNDCMFSNLGMLHIPHQYSSFVVDTIYSPSVIGPLGNTTTLLTSTYKGQLDFSFIASEGFLPRKDAEAIKEKFIDILKTEFIQAPQLYTKGVSQA